MDHREAVGACFDPARMALARTRSWAALRAISERMRPGISEEEARAQALQVFSELGVERLWHPVLIRIGANTRKTYRQRSDPTVRLGENDIYFIDLGLVFDGHEGDVATPSRSATSRSSTPAPRPPATCSTRWPRPGARRA